MFQLSSDYVKVIATTGTKEEKGMVKVEFLKDYLHYKCWMTALLEENMVDELIRCGYARKATTWHALNDMGALRAVRLAF